MDYIVDCGPEGGDEGGKIVALDTTKQIAEHPSSYTGNYLKPVLDIHSEKNHVEYVEERKHMPKINPNVNNKGFYRNGS